MKAAIGSKIILFEPMTQEYFNMKYKATGVIVDGQEQTPGYHVQYPNPDGALYDSWSPKDVFDNAYRPVTDQEKAILK